MKMNKIIKFFVGMIGFFLAYIAISGAIPFGYQVFELYEKSVAGLFAGITVFFVLIAVGFLLIGISLHIIKNIWKKLNSYLIIGFLLLLQACSVLRQQMLDGVPEVVILNYSGIEMLSCSIVGLILFVIGIIKYKKINNNSIN